MLKKKPSARTIIIVAVIMLGAMVLAYVLNKKDQLMTMFDEFRTGYKEGSGDV